MTAPSDPSNVPPRQPPVNRSFSARQVAGAVLIILAVIFIFENTKRVEVRLIGPVLHAPLYVALLIAALLGSLGTLLLQWRRRRRE